MYKIILFDLDDTLLDFNLSRVRSLEQIHSKFYSSIDFQYFEHRFNVINQRLWSRVGSSVSSLSPAAVGLQRFINLHIELGVRLSAEKVSNEFCILLGETADWLPGVQKAIQFLHQKNYILGIITNGIAVTQQRKYERHQLHQWFDCFVVSDIVGLVKPSKEIFEYAFSELGKARGLINHEIERNAVLMVGDSLTSDGQGAQNAAIDFCHVGNAEMNGLALGIKHRLTSVAELPFYLGYRDEYSQFLAKAMDAIVIG